MGYAIHHTHALTTLATLWHTLRQGNTRFERGRAFYEAGKELAAKLDADFRWRLVIVPDVAHEHARMSVTAADYLLD